MHTFRRFVTSSVGFSFIIVGLTGVIFKFFFKNHTLEEIHAWVGLVMVAAALFHIIQNWNALKRHLLDTRVYALLIPIGVICGLIVLRGEPKAGLNPRRVMRQITQASADNVAKTFGKDVHQVIISMQKDGIAVDSSEETLAQLAEKNHRPPEKILAYFAL